MGLLTMGCIPTCVSKAMDGRDEGPSRRTPHSQIFERKATLPHFEHAGIELENDPTPKPALTHIPT